MIGNAILGVLGLANIVSEAATVVSAGEDAMTLINAAKKLLDSHEGQQFREKVVSIVEVTKKQPDGSIHIGYEAHKDEDVTPPPAGHWEWDWDALQGYVNPHWVGDKK